MAIINRSVSQTLSLTTSAVSNLKKQSISSNLLLTDIARSGRERASSVLTVTQSVSHNLRNTKLIDNLVLTDSASTKYTKRVSAESTIQLTQGLRESLPHRDVDNTLDITQSVHVNQKFEVSASSLLSLSDGVVLRRSITNIDIVQYISLSQQAARTIYEDAENTINLSDSSEKIFFEVVPDYLYLQQSVDYILTKKGVDNDLSIYDEVQVIKVKVLTATSTLNLGSVCATYTEFPSKYIWSDAPILISQDHITLTFPFVDPSSTLELRNPEFGNVDSLEHVRINRETRNKKLIMFRDAIWATINVLAFDFAHLKQEDIHKLENFISESLGKEIGLLDFEGRQWKGIIVTPDIENTQDERFSFGSAFRFQGELV